MPTLLQLLQRTVDQYGSHTALIEPAGADTMSSLTYRALQERACRFAGYLQQQHVTKGMQLMIWSESRIAWLIAFFGALLLGMVVVPVDVRTKEEFMERIVSETDIKFLVTTHKQYQGLRHIKLSFLDIDALPEGTLNIDALPAVTEQDLAELVFTSGTTGTPKGVMLSHGNITSNALAALKIVEIRSNDRALSILPLSHMFEMTIEIAVIASGASVVYARTLAPDTLLKLLSSQDITCMVLVPQALHLFMASIERTVREQKREKEWKWLHRIAARLPFGLRRYLFAPVHHRFGGHFRFFVSGGAYLSPTLAQRWEEMGFRILQGYGTTECSPVVSATLPHDHHFDTVGKPLPGVEVRIADDGEILVRGPNVAQGYWKNPDATAQAFKDGWYYTGDLGFFDERGNLHLKGRKKNMIVLANGLNVYAEDIENVLCSLEGVKDAMVIGLMDNEQGPEVHAVLLLQDPGRARTIVQQANKRLAPHQQIRSFTVWPETDFPRVHTLKVKRPEVESKLMAMRAKK
jgi:long-chain acyl-CoA synthetase